MGLFNEYHVHRDFMSLLNAAKVLVNRIVLPKIVHIFGTAVRKPLDQQRQQQTGLQRVHTLELVNKIMGPKLKHLDDWYRDHSYKNVQPADVKDYLVSVNFNYKLYHKVKTHFGTVRHIYNNNA
jgi:hypothetical protein